MEQEKKIPRQRRQAAPSYGGAGAQLTRAQRKKVLDEHEKFEKTRQNIAKGTKDWRAYMGNVKSTQAEQNLRIDSLLERYTRTAKAHAKAIEKYKQEIARAKEHKVRAAAALREAKEYRIATRKAEQERQRQASERIQEEIRRTQDLIDATVAPPAEVETATKSIPKVVKVDPKKLGYSPGDSVGENAQRTEDFKAKLEETLDDLNKRNATPEEKRTAVSGMVFGDQVDMAQFSTEALRIRGMLWENLWKRLPEEDRKKFGDGTLRAFHDMPTPERIKAYQDVTGMSLDELNVMGLLTLGHSEVPPTPEELREVFNSLPHTGPQAQAQQKEYGVAGNLMSWAINLAIAYATGTLSVPMYAGLAGWKSFKWMMQYFASGKDENSWVKAFHAKMESAENKAAVARDFVFGIPGKVFKLPFYATERVARFLGRAPMNEEPYVIDKILGRIGSTMAGIGAWANERTENRPATRAALGLIALASTPLLANYALPFVTGATQEFMRGISDVVVSSFGKVVQPVAGGILGALSQGFGWVGEPLRTAIGDATWKDYFTGWSLQGGAWLSKQFFGVAQKMVSVVGDKPAYVAAEMFNKVMMPVWGKVAGVMWPIATASWMAGVNMWAASLLTSPITDPLRRKAQQWREQGRTTLADVVDAGADGVVTAVYALHMKHGKDIMSAQNLERIRSFFNVSLDEARELGSYLKEKFAQTAPDQVFSVDPSRELPGEIHIPGESETRILTGNDMRTHLEQIYGQSIPDEELPYYINKYTRETLVREGVAQGVALSAAAGAGVEAAATEAGVEAAGAAAATEAGVEAAATEADVETDPTQEPTQTTATPRAQRPVPTAERVERGRKLAAERVRARAEQSAESLRQKQELHAPEQQAARAARMSEVQIPVQGETQTQLLQGEEARAWLEETTGRTISEEEFPDVAREYQQSVRENAAFYPHIVEGTVQLETRRINAMEPDATFRVPVLDPRSWEEGGTWRYEYVDMDRARLVEFLGDLSEITYTSDDAAQAAFERYQTAIATVGVVGGVSAYTLGLIAAMIKGETDAATGAATGAGIATGLGFSTFTTGVGASTLYWLLAAKTAAASAVGTISAPVMGIGLRSAYYLGVAGSESAAFAAHAAFGAARGAAGAATTVATQATTAATVGATIATAGTALLSGVAVSSLTYLFQRAWEDFDIEAFSEGVKKRQMEDLAELEIMAEYARELDERVAKRAAEAAGS